MANSEGARREDDRNRAITGADPQPIGFKIDPATVRSRGRLRGRAYLESSRPDHHRSDIRERRRHLSEVEGRSDLGNPAVVRAYDPSALNFESDFGWFLKNTLWACDTGDYYAAGHNELLIGRALAGAIRP
jgi:hypothetical protein